MLTRSRDLRLQGALAGLIEANDVFVWPAEEFDPVADAVARTFARLGLLAGPAAVAA